MFLTVFYSVVISQCDDFEPGVICCDHYICEGGLSDSFYFTTPPSGGGGAYTYTWLVCFEGDDCTNPPADYFEIPDVGSGAVLQGQSFSENFFIIAKVKSADCEDYTNFVEITVIPKQEVSIQAYVDTACVGATVVIDATITGGPDPGECSIIWEYTDDGNNWHVLEDEYGLTANVNTSVPFNDRIFIAGYECDVSGCYDEVSSNPVTITILDAPVWGQIDFSPDELCEGGEVTFFTEVEHELEGHVVWYSSPGGEDLWEEVTSPHILTTTGEWDFRPEYVPDLAGCEIEELIINTVNVYDNPYVVSISANETEICPSDSIILTAVVGGGVGDCSYYWELWNGTDWISVSSGDSVYNVPTTNPMTNVPHRVRYSCTGVGCDDAFSNEIEITIHPDPASTAISNSPICEYEDLIFTVDTGISWNWEGPDSFSSSDQNPIIASATIDASGVYYVTVTDDNGCVGKKSIEVIINENPVPTAVNDSPICSGQSLNLQVDKGVSWNWEGPDGFVNTAQNPQILSATLDAIGTYHVTVTDANNCTAETETEVDVKLSPVAVATNSGPYCAGDVIIFYAEPDGMEYMWEGPDDFLSTEQNPQIPQAVPTATGVYTLIVTAGNGCSDTTSTFVEVGAIIYPTVVNNSPICEGEDLNLEVSEGVSWNWEGPDGFSSSEQNPVISVVTVNASGFYTVTITDGIGCTGKDSTEVIINTNPEPIIESNDPICVGNDLILQANEGILWTWEGPDGFSSEVQHPVIFSATMDASGIYTLTVTDVNGCTAETSVNVIVYDSDDIQVIYDIIEEIQCYGDSTAVVEISISGGVPLYDLRWENGLLDSLQGVDAGPHTISDLSYGNYIVEVIDINGCALNIDMFIDQPDEISVNVNMTREPSCNGYGDGEISIEISGSMPNFDIEMTGPSSGIIPDVEEGTYIIDGLFAGDYYFIVTDNNGCEKNENFTITQPDEIEISIEKGDALCHGESSGWAIATASGGGEPYEYLWEPGEYNYSGISNLYAGTYFVTVTDVNDCENQSQVIINEPPLDIIIEITKTDVTCYKYSNGQAFVEATGGTAPYSYYWSGPNDYYYYSAQTSNNLTTGTYYLTITDINNCKFYDQTVIEEPDSIQVIVKHYEGPTCLGHNDGFILLDSITGGAPPYWIRVYKEDSFIEQQSLYFDSLYSGVYRIDVIDGNNCTHYGRNPAVQLIEDEMKCINIPAAFSPNEDGYNDTWQIDNLYIFPKALIQVYNRWGQLIYEGDANSPFWDGTYNGSPVPTGVYLYHIDLHADLKPIYGTVTIIR